MPTPGSSRTVHCWTPEEDDLLKEWQEKLGNKWAKVASHIPGRTGQQCAQRWRHKGNPEISKARWTAEEDERLAQLVAEHGNAWARIARQLPGRTDQQCMGRWRRHLDPRVNYGPWQRREDEALRSLVQQYGACWAAMAPHLGNRTPQQCRSRYMRLVAEAEEKALRKRRPKPPSILTSTSPASKPCRKRRSVRFAVQEDAENVPEDCSKKQPGFKSQQSRQFCGAPELARARRGSSAEQRVPLAETRLLQNQETRLLQHQEHPESPSEVFVPRRPRRRTVVQRPLPAAQDLPPAAALPGMLGSDMQPPLPTSSSNAEDLLPRRHQSARRQTRSAVAAVATRVAPPSSGGSLPLQPPSEPSPGFTGLPDSQHVLYTFALPKTEQGPNHRLLSPAAAQQLLRGPVAAGIRSGPQVPAASTLAAAIGHRQAHPSLAKANTELEQADDTVLYTNALFLWLQLLLLKPLQPVLASHSAEMARRMRQLAWITAATYFLFCWPCLA